MFRKFVARATTQFGLALALCCNVFNPSARAELVTFDLGLSGNASVNGLDLEGFSSASTSVTGSEFTVTMAASVQTTSVFNLTNRGLGINSPGGDRGGQIDARGVPNEGLDFNFLSSVYSAITIVSFDFQGIGGNGNPGQDQAEIRFSSGNIVTVDGTTVNTFDQITVNEVYTPGSNVSISHIDGLGFRLQSITLDVVPLPEPSTTLMFGFVIGFIGRIRTRGSA